MAVSHEVPVGIIVSTTGPYATVGREIADGALLALERFNAASQVLRLVPVLADPGGSLDAYAAAAKQMTSDGGVAHILGCYTSSSRKELIPIVEKHDALLWYPSHYEGFESCDNVIYGGAAPNQHVVPLAKWALPRFGTRAYAFGSNYLWSWENTRIFRDLVHSAGGYLLRERYLAMDDTDLDAILREIRELAPDFVFNSAIGETSYSLFRAYNRLGHHDPRFLPERRPILSCTISEPEVQAIGIEAAAGHVASSVYFQSIRSEDNSDFVAAFRTRFGAVRTTSADAEAAYNSMLLLGAALSNAGTAEIGAVRKALYGCHLTAPQGEVWIDPDNNHAWLTPRIGRVQLNGQFCLEWQAANPVRPDPYLVTIAQERTGIVRPRLRLVGSP